VRGLTPWLFGAVPIAAFAAAFAATWLGSSGATPAVDARILVSLEEQGRLPASYLAEIGTDGAGRRSVTMAPRAGELVTAVDMQAQWSRAAGLIVFARESFTAAGEGTPTKLYTVRPDGTGLRRVTRGSNVDRYPAWSPDGSRIALAHDVGVFEIFVMKSDGAEFTQLTAGTTSADEYPAWSPDGRRLVYASTTNENADLYVMNADGSGQRPLLEGPQDDSAPAWSPDGGRIAFVRGGHLHVVDAGGSEVRQLTRGRPGYGRPGWSPDGATLVTADDRGGVFLVDADDGEVRRVPLAGPASWPAWGRG
jgi:Tol biopolymer transport system component